MYSDRQLGLEGRWFTGQEWASGVAQRELTREFHAAEEKLKRKGVKPESPKKKYQPSGSTWKPWWLRVVDNG